MTPQNLGRYEILGELGKGAMGVVYLAQDPIIKRQLAIKTFRMAYSAKEKEVAQFRERFLREAQAIGQLSHPNIVTVHDVGQEGEDYFIAMEYVKGVNLKQRMQHDEPLALEFVLEVVAQIADGLDCAHQKGIIHRDVKPANIIITHDHLVKITDFGIARLEQSNLTVAGQLLGTPNYMAPEQIQGRAVDARSDIFSLGVLLYELLTRKKPFQGENLTQVSHRIVYDEFTPPEEYV
ncbi:MAG TPA: serine/threonine-protein kinase, partial [Thermoanaerobaculia bacterium]